MSWPWPHSFAGFQCCSCWVFGGTHLCSATLDDWASLCAREGFRGGPLLDAAGTLQLFNSSHVRERDNALLRGVLVGGVWNGYFVGRVRGQPVPCRLCGGPDGEGHLFGRMHLSSPC